MVEGNIGTVGNYDLEFKDGKIQGTVKIAQEPTAGVSVSADVNVSISAKAVLEAIKRAIPNAVVDELITLVEAIPGVQ